MYGFMMAPPIALLILILSVLALSWFASTVAPKSGNDKRKIEAYAGGQRQASYNINPDCSPVFQYAFFFVILQAVVLVVATAPAGALTLPLLYVMAGALTLVIVFRG